MSHASAPLRIAVLVEDEKTFLLPTLDRTISAWRDAGFIVTHIGVVPPRVSRYRGVQIPFWYLRTFGFRNTALLTAYRGLESLRRLRAHLGPEKLSLSWSGLARKFTLVLRFLPDPNSSDALDQLRMSECDILFIMVPYVLRPPVLEIPRLGTINKHAALLPACRGLFPYVWSTIRGLPLGVTFHRVTVRVDAGPVLIERRLDASRQPRSMIEFYRWVFSQFPEMAVAAARKLVAPPSDKQVELGPGGYFGVPSRADYRAFRAAGGQLICLADLVHSEVPLAR